MTVEPVRILVVDDDVTIREVIKDFLVEMDYEIDVAANGEEAVLAVKKHVPRLIIMDLNLPDMNGEDLIRRIAQSYSGIRFVIHTGVSSYSPSEDLKKIGITRENILLKPFRHIKDLNDIITQILEKN